LKKNIFTAFAASVFAASTLLLSCSDTNKTIISGNFTQSSIITSELYLNPDDTSSYIGTCVINNSITLSFNENSDYSLKINQKLDSCNLSENSTYTQADLEGYFKKNLEIQGIYKATNTNLTLSNLQVITEDGTTVSFEQYMTQDPSVGEKVQTVEYNLTEDKLTLIQNNNYITYNKQ